MGITDKELLKWSKKLKVAFSKMKVGEQYADNNPWEIL